MLKKLNLLIAASALSLGALAADPAQLSKAAQGDVAAQIELAEYYYDMQDYHKAVEWYTKAANQGLAYAQTNLGLMYYEGQGVRQDYYQAFKWYTKAANQGHALAQFNLGVLYEYGQGVRQNKTTAKIYYGQACDHGLQLGCDNYRLLHQQGY
ncbi:tetratricopeptide repeat protein [Moraxella canis]|uniref:tetratricopeptide repeat protein n=1 Tax=Moraxella canis TaxID=90239 RepID=UPI0006693824|nr:tetratricopeptide repeat protein [Moraxella canis]